MNETKQTRVRFAPSPTGFLHVGGVRTLLFNWLYAKKNQGKLILRVEDTDQARSTPENERMMLSDIEALGLRFDEGPNEGGPYAPYRQSERLPFYAEQAKKLLQEGKVYYCFCPEALLTQKRESAMKLGKSPHYDGTCAKISAQEAKQRLSQGEKAGLRFKVPHLDMVLEDKVRGRIEFKVGMVGDFFITRTPSESESEIAEGIGMPVYNFCCVVDDHLMKLSHVIRGEDHLSNTTRQLMLYEALGWEPPRFAHISMVLGADHQKLSKRNGDVSVRDYLNQGYLPEVLLNFLVLLGWWPPKDFKPVSGHPEVLSQEELIRTFDLEGLQKSPAVFDPLKLKWMNSFYLRMLPLKEVALRAKPFFSSDELIPDKLIKDATWFEQVIDAVRGEVTLLNELPQAARLFFETIPTLDEEGLKFLQQPASQKIVESLLGTLKSKSGDFSTSEIEELSKKIAAETGVKGKELFMPIRAVITGKTHGPELKKILPLLGRDKVIERIEILKKQAGL